MLYHMCVARAAPTRATHVIWPAAQEIANLNQAGGEDFTSRRRNSDYFGCELKDLARNRADYDGAPLATEYAGLRNNHLLA